MDRVREVRPPLYEILKSGLEEGISWAQGETELRVTKLTIPEPPPAYDASRVAALRQRLKLSQIGFAQLLNVSPKTVQSWEQGVRTPSHAAARLLQLIENPKLLSLS
jgi:putative transcriptional regulator